AIAVNVVERAPGSLKAPQPEGTALQARATAAGGSAVRACRSIRSPWTTELRGATISPRIGRPSFACCVPASNTVASSKAGKPRSQVTEKEAAPMRIPAPSNASIAMVCAPGRTGIEPVSSAGARPVRKVRAAPPVSAEAVTWPARGRLGQRRTVTAIRLPGYCGGGADRQPNENASTASPTAGRRSTGACCHGPAVAAHGRGMTRTLLRAFMPPPWGSGDEEDHDRRRGSRGHRGTRRARAGLRIREARREAGAPPLEQPQPVRDEGGREPVRAPGRVAGRIRPIDVEAVQLGER